DGNDSWKTLVTNFVTPLQKINRIEIFTATENIRDPLPFFARIIEIKHGRDRIHPQPVNVIFVEPEKRVRDQEIANLAASIIKNERPPDRKSTRLNSSAYLVCRLL